MTQTTQEILEAADLQWQMGQLLSAQDGYQKALDLDPECWHAQLQLIWFDAAFGKINSEDLARLEQMDTPDHAEPLLENLRVRLEFQEDNDPSYLDGTLKSWDIDRLKLLAFKVPQRWISYAQRAYKAELEGLANTCYREAERLAPDLFFDPDSEVSRAEERAKLHIHTLQGKVP